MLQYSKWPNNNYHLIQRYLWIWKITGEESDKLVDHHEMI